MRIVQSKLISTVDIVDGSITNVKVNAAAAIVSTKLDLSAVAQDILPSGVRDLGSNAARFEEAHINTTLNLSGTNILNFIALWG